MQRHNDTNRDALAPRAPRRLGLLRAAVAALLCSCASEPRLTHAERFYPQTPETRTFTFERVFPGGQGAVRGTLEFAIDAVGIVDGEAPVWRMSGAATLVARGVITGRDAARAAPRQVVVAAMEPSNVPEVFESVSSQPGVVVTRVHWDQLRSLRLPLEYDQNAPAAPFTSSLRADALASPAEVALVWHKVLAPHLSIAPFGTYTASGVDEREDELTLTLDQELPNGEAMSFTYRMASPRGLIALEGVLDDGSTLKLVASE